MNKITVPGRVFLTLKQIRNIGNKKIKSKLDYISNELRFVTSSNYDRVIKKIASEIKKSVTEEEIKAAIQEHHQIVESCHKDIKILSIFDNDYPLLLKDLDDAPPIIYTRGNLSLLSRSISIVGTRKPTEIGKEIASRVGQYYIEKGFSICNGLAEGIDLCAIQAPHRVSSNTIGILGIGLNLNVGTKHYLDAGKLVLEANGLLISEELPNSKGSQYTAISACRIQAALSKVTVLIQSSKSGGTRFTIQKAVELGRLVGVIFPVSSEYQSSENEANRLIIEGSSGNEIATFVGKSGKSPRFQIIRSKSDYQLIDAELITDKSLDSHIASKQRTLPFED